MLENLFIKNSLQIQDVFQFEKQQLNSQARKTAKNIIHYGSELFSEENINKFNSNTINTVAITVPLVFVGCCAMRMTAQGNGCRILLETMGDEINKLYWRTTDHLPRLIFLTSVSMALQYLTSSKNVFSEKKCSLKEKSISLLKEKSNNFLAGVCSLPRGMVSNIYSCAITVAMLWAFGIENSNSGKIGITEASYSEYIAKLSYLDLAIVGPFYEEVFYRACMQSIINSSLKIVSSAGRHFRMGEISGSTISKCSRIGSSILFGLAHYDSLTHMVATGIGSYLTFSQLYDEKGFFASFGAHLAHNSLCFINKCLF